MTSGGSATEFSPARDPIPPHINTETSLPHQTHIIDSMSWKAICQCGLSEISLPGPPKGLFICHCLSCRKQSSSAFGMSAYYPANSIPLSHPTLKTYERPAESGYIITGYFCEKCGCRLVHVNSRGYISVKGGAIEGCEKLDWGGATHVFTRSKLPWVVIPEGVKVFEGQAR